MRPGGSGAAETFEPRQIREEAAVRGSLWAPPGRLPGCTNNKRAVLVRTALFVWLAVTTYIVPILEGSYK
jgi:hypothetical protein